MFGRLFAVFGVAAAKEQPSMHLGIKRLHPPAKHFRPAGEFGHVAHRNARVTQQLCRPAGGKDLNAQGSQPLREIHDSGLVKNADQRALDRHIIPPPRDENWKFYVGREDWESLNGRSPLRSSREPSIWPGRPRLPRRTRPPDSLSASGGLSFSCARTRETPRA